MDQQVTAKTVRISEETHRLLKKHKEETMRGGIGSSIAWLVKKYAEQDIEETKKIIRKK